MTTLQLLWLIIYCMIGFILVMLSVLLYVNRKDIAAFFFPQDWAEVTILESDNNIRTWLQKKSADLSFKFNMGKYNMFEKQPEEKKAEAEGLEKVPTPDRKGTAIYRSGRLSRFFYIEGCPDPLDFRQVKITGNAQLTEQLDKVQVMDLFTGQASQFEEVWRKIAPFVIIAGFLLVIFFLWQNNQMQQAAQQAAANQMKLG